MATTKPAMSAFKQTTQSDSVIKHHNGATRTTSRSAVEGEEYGQHKHPSSPLAV